MSAAHVLRVLSTRLSSRKLSSLHALLCPSWGAAPPRAQPQHLFSYIYTWLASGFTVSHSLYPPLCLSLPTYLTATDVVSIACFGRFLPFLYLEMTCCIVHTGEIRTLSENVTIEKVI